MAQHASDFSPNFKWTNPVVQHHENIGEISVDLQNRGRPIQNQENTVRLV